MSWQILLAISVVGLSVSVLLQRILLHDYKTDPHAYVIIFQSLVALFITLYAFIYGFKLPDISLWPQMLMTFVLYGWGHMFYAKSLQSVEASVFSILFATNAIWVMIMGYLVFDEKLTPVQAIGSILIFLSVGLLVERKGQFKLDKGVLFGLLTGLMFGLAVTNWVWVSQFTEVNTWNAISFAGPAVVVLLTKPKSLTKMRRFARPEILARISLLGILFAISATTLLNAFIKGQTSIIAPLQQTNIILTIILAVIFLKERDRLWQKALAGAICFIGVVLIVL